MVHKIVDMPRGMMIAECFDGYGLKHNEEARSNARLMAAAPDLLYALEYVMTAHGEQLTDAFDMAQKAISKARDSLV